MDYYHVWVDLRDGVRDVQFAAAVRAYLDHLRVAGAIEEWRLSRRKLGFGPDSLGEWHVVMAIRDLAQLDAAFRLAARRAGETETVHAAVYGCVARFASALYRDFPDAVRDASAASA